MPAPVSADRPAAPLAHRVFSLCGVVPLGAFLVVHLVVNARVLRGEPAFVSAAGALAGLPGVRAIEVLFVLAPLVFHGLFGAWLIATRTPLPSPYGRPLTLAMRATGAAALAFLALHVVELGVLSPGPRAAPAVMLTVLSAGLSDVWHGVPWRGVVYLAGTGAVVFHFVVGLWAAFARSETGQDATVRRAAGWAATILGAAMSLLFVDVVVLYATGSRLIGSPAAEPASSAPCPASSSLR